jgi:hypothetical protein
MKYAVFILWLAIGLPLLGCTISATIGLATTEILVFFHTIPKSPSILKFALLVFGLAGVIQGYILSWKIFVATSRGSGLPTKAK